MSQKRVQLSLGSLDDRQLKQLLDKVRAERLARRQVRSKTVGLRGRPSDEMVVSEACKRILKTLSKQKKTTLEGWYQKVEQLTKLSRGTTRKWTRKWLISNIPFKELPREIGAYYIASSKEFREVGWILVWGGLAREFPGIAKWLRDYQSRAACLPHQWPHEVLPGPFQDTIMLRLNVDRVPECYDRFVREALQQGRIEYGSGSALALKETLGRVAEK